MRTDHARACRPPPARGCCGRPTAPGCRPRTRRSRARRAAPARRACRAAAPRRRSRPAGSSALRRRQRKPAASISPGTCGEALGVSRRHQQPRLRHALADAVEGREHQLLLAVHRAARHPQRAPGAAGVHEPHQALGRPARLDRVELEVAGDPHALGGRRHRADPLGVRLALHQEQVDLGEHRGEQAAHAPVARERARRDAAVHDRHARAAAARLVDQVRPQLGLDQQQQRGIHDLERAAHRSAGSRRARRTGRRARAGSSSRPRCRSGSWWRGRRGGRETSPGAPAPAGAPPAPRPPRPRGSRSSGRRPGSGRPAGAPCARGRCAGTSRTPAPSRGRRAARARNRARGRCCRGCAPCVCDRRSRKWRSSQV